MRLLILPQKGHDSVASLIIPCTSKRGLELGSAPNLPLQPHRRKYFRRSVEQNQDLGVLGLALVESTPKRGTGPPLQYYSATTREEGRGRGGCGRRSGGSGGGRRDRRGGQDLRSCVLVRGACHRPAGSKPAPKGDWSQGGRELFFNKAFGSASREAGAGAVLGAVP